MRKTLFSTTKITTNFSLLRSKRNGDFVYKISKADNDDVYKVSIFMDSCSFSLNDRLLEEKYMSGAKLMEDNLLKTLITSANDEKRCPNEEYPIL